MFKINNIPVGIQRYPDKTPRLNISVDSDDFGDSGNLSNSGDLNKITLEWFYEKDEEMILYFIARHLRRQYQLAKLTLYMPYVPHARMDRVKNKQEVFTLKYFCEFINSIGFDQVIVRDAHSSVSLALLDNVVSEPIDQVIMKLANRLLDPQKDIVFYPDEGSCKRYSEMLSFPCAFGVKKRDWDSGQILGLDVQGTLPEAPFSALIIDDIVSYGGTVLHSAKKLKALGADKVYLYVTHCENAILEGELIGSGLLEKIYTTRSIYTGDHPLIVYVD